MKTVAAFSLLVVSSFATLVSAQTVDFPSVTTPGREELKQCTPYDVEFTGGTGPWTLSVLPAKEAYHDPFEHYDNIQSSPYTWTVNANAGSSVQLLITDSTGASGVSFPVDIGDGPDDCNPVSPYPSN